MFYTAQEDVQESAGLMTLHFVLRTNREDELIWVTDQRAWFNQYSFSDVEKITYLEARMLACSVWGDLLAVSIRDELCRRLMDGSVRDCEPETLLAAVADIMRAFKIDTAAKDPRSRGLIVVTHEGPIRILQFYLTWPPARIPVTDTVIAGDGQNLGNLFPSYYYERSDKSFAEVLLMGFHGMVIARQLNAQAIGKPNVWALHAGKFRRLSMEELLPYAGASISLNETIVAHIKNAPPFGASPLSFDKMPV